jgi:peptidoglycan-associated lipoprotein
MSFSKTTFKLTMISVLAITAAACASRPKPAPMASAPPPSSMGPAPMPYAGPAAPVPGSVQDFVINVGDRVYFDFDQYTIRADGAPILDAQARWLNQYPAVHVRIEGNADERGTREYNLALGARRANSVREFLASRGVAAGRVETVSFGKERPLDPGTSEDAYQRNRNSHTTITGGAVGPSTY